MLAETIVYVRSLAAAPPGFRRNIHGAVGLWARGRRQAKAWAQHIASTRGLIDTSIDDFSRRRVVAVLGSGPLFDLPLEALARTFGQVLLVDHAHLVTIDRRIGRYANVVREWRELSPLACPDPLAWLQARADLDWAISLNLLSQVVADAPEARQREIVDGHLADLASLDCRATLVADFDYRIVDRNGRLIEKADLLAGRPMPPPDLTWKWEVAPFGEEAPHTRRVHTVGAWLDWRETG
jgi:hypothetical protein